MARQGKIFLFGVVLYFFIRSSLIGSKEVEGTYFTRVAFHKLEGNSLRTLSVRSVFQCGMRCGRVPKCSSFNVAVLPTKNGLYECVMLKNVESESPDHLVATQEYHHYIRFVDPCSNTRCKNGGTCEAVGNDFRCRCTQGFTGKLCSTCIGIALGMENSVIPDSSITASSIYSSSYGPHRARLHGGSSWRPATPYTNSWLQVDLSTITNITKIATQGYFMFYIKKYSLQYGSNSSYFEDYEGGKALTGNTDDDTVVKNTLQPAIIARYFRILPKTWQVLPSLRMELYGCSQGNEE